MRKRSFGTASYCLSNNEYSVIRILDAVDLVILFLELLFTPSSLAFLDLIRLGGRSGTKQ